GQLLPVSLLAASLALSLSFSAPCLTLAEPWSAWPSACRSRSPVAAPADSLARPPSSSALFENLSPTPMWCSSRSRHRDPAPPDLHRTETRTGPPPRAGHDRVTAEAPHRGGTPPRSPPGAEEPLEDRGALVLEHPAPHLWTVDQAPAADHVPQRPARPGTGLPGTG